LAISSPDSKAYSLIKELAFLDLKDRDLKQLKEGHLYHFAVLRCYCPLPQNAKQN